MSEITPTDAASCRTLAVLCGRRANKHWARGFTGKAKREIERARELMLLALQLESAAAIPQANPPSTPPEGREQNT